MLKTATQEIAKPASRERTDEEWVTELAFGDTGQSAAIADLRIVVFRAVRAYLGRQGKRLQRFGWSELEHIADDFTQDAMLKVLDNVHTFEGRSRFTTWAMRVAINTAASGLRRKMWQDVPLMETNEDGEEFSIVDGLNGAEKQGSPEAALERQEAIDILREIIVNELTERQRKVMLNVLVHGMPIEIVAARMNTNRNNVYKITHDARLRLRKGLLDSGFTPEYVLSFFGEIR
jgi:RNA polymerase sigma-70 factor (ECF subfamily)